MIITPLVERTYPSFVARFVASMAQLEGDPDLWPLLTKEGQISKMSARDLVRSGPGMPRVQVTPLSTVASYFNPNWPDDIDIGRDLVRYAEMHADDTDVIRHAVVAATGALIDRWRARIGLTSSAPPWSQRILPLILGADYEDEPWFLNGAPPGTGKAISLDATDRDALARLAVAEAGIQVSRGVPPRTAFGSIVDAVVNRIASEWSYWGSTVEKVINQPAQFEPISKTSNKSWTGLQRATASQQQVVVEYLEVRSAGGANIVGPATHFLNPGVKYTAHAQQTWAKKMSNLIIIGKYPNAHLFGNADTYTPKPHHIVLE